ncbi:hypothetical protein, partial [Rhizobium chutanense]|uniref:hypothetical protein n=1 Tax=Rhizobium chutanense TaxID=2035448 RepID=UPI001AECE332
SSSPAAPPPSFSEWAYRTIPFSKSTALFEKNEVSFIRLFSQRNFLMTPKCGRFPDSDRLEMAGKMNLFRLFVERTLFHVAAPRHHHNLLVLRDA